MAQRPQPSLRLADGGSFITRWAQSVMRPNATANRLREADAPPPPPAAPVRAPAPPPPNPNATPDNPAGIRFQDGGHVPGTGRGDKIPAKYEPGEFVVSNDMIDDNPGLREQLSGLRAETLAARGKTVEEADAKALNGGRRPSLRAVEGFDPFSRMAKDLTGQNPLPPRSPMGGVADDLARNAANVPDAPPRPAGPGNPNVPPGGSAEARAFQQARGAPVAAPPSPAVDAPMPAKASTLRNAASAIGNGLLYGGAGVGGALAAKGLSDVGAPKGTAAVPGERQAGDSANSMQIPTGRGGAEPTPGAQPYNFWTDSEAGRNIGNAVNAIAPLGGIAMAARVPGAASRAFGVADAALGGLSAGVHNERASANTATSAAPTLRTRPEDTFAGPPAAAAGAASSATDPGAPRRVDRPGQSPLFTNVADDAPYIGNNALMARGAAPSAQNMAAADNLAASSDITPRLRAQAQYDAEVANAQRINSMQQRMNGAGSRSAQLDLRSPENLAARNASVSSNLDYNRMSRSEIQARTSLAGIEAQKQTAQMQNQTALRGQDINAETSRYGADASTDASRYGSDNSLRSQMYSSDAQLGAKQMEMQQRLRQQQAIGGAFRDNKGDPVATARALAGAGLTDAAKSFQDMAGADQTRTQNNVKDARSTFDNMFTRDGKSGPERDENAEALAHSLASQIVPGWENMSAEQRAANRTKVVDATKVVQGMNRERNASLGQWLGVSKPTPAYSQLPDLGGAQVGEVGFLDGLTPWGPARGATKVTLRDGQERYIPKGELSESQQRLLEDNGAKRAN